MTYGKPSYTLDGVVEVGFASQKLYISVNVLEKGVVASYRDELFEVSISQVCIRFGRAEKVDPEALRRQLEAAAISAEVVC